MIVGDGQRLTTIARDLEGFVYRFNRVPIRLHGTVADELNDPAASTARDE